MISISLLLYPVLEVNDAIHPLICGDFRGILDITRIVLPCNQQSTSRVNKKDSNLIICSYVLILHIWIVTIIN